MLDCPEKWGTRSHSSFGPDARELWDQRPVCIPEVSATTLLSYSPGKALGSRAAGGCTGLSPEKVPFGLHKECLSPKEEHGSQKRAPGLKSPLEWEPGERLPGDQHGRWRSHDIHRQAKGTRDQDGNSLRTRGWWCLCLLSSLLQPVGPGQVRGDRSIVVK